MIIIITIMIDDDDDVGDYYTDHGDGGLGAVHRGLPHLDPGHRGHWRRVRHLYRH